MLVKINKEFYGFQILLVLQRIIFKTNDFDLEIELKSY